MSVTWSCLVQHQCKMLAGEREGEGGIMLERGERDSSQKQENWFLDPLAVLIHMHAVFMTLVCE